MCYDKLSNIEKRINILGGKIISIMKVEENYKGEIKFWIGSGAVEPMYKKESYEGFLLKDNEIKIILI